MLFVVLCPGTPEGSTGSGSGFKASQKTGQRLKVSSDRLGEAGNRTCDPWFTRHRFIPYTTAASLYEVLLLCLLLRLISLISAFVIRYLKSKVARSDISYFSVLFGEIKQDEASGYAHDNVRFLRFSQKQETVGICGDEGDELLQCRDLSSDM